MSFLTEKEQIEKFWQDKIVQEDILHLRTLIGKKSIFAQKIGLKEVAGYLKDLFEEAEKVRRKPTNNIKGTIKSVAKLW